MEEKIMIIKIIGVIIGAAICGTGVFYLQGEKEDPESRKIYTVITGIGVAVTAVSLLLLILGIFA